MTKKMWISSMAVAALFSLGSALADEPAAPVAAPAGGNPAASVDGNKHPCRKLVKEAIAGCKAAGFEKGKHKEGKGLFKDCVKPLKEGKSVAGVTLDANLVQACQARKAEKAKK